jgi:benzoyl-CoA reductase subunit BamC
MCESDPTLKEPLCVQWCITDALTYEEREEEGEEEPRPEDIEVGLEALVEKFGWEKIQDTINRLMQSKKGE